MADSNSLKRTALEIAPVSGANKSDETLALLKALRDEIERAFNIPPSYVYIPVRVVEHINVEIIFDL